MESIVPALNLQQQPLTQSRALPNARATPYDREVELGLENIRSPDLSEQGEVSLDDDIILIDNLISDDVPLLNNPGARGQNSGFRVDVLVMVVYQYLRVGLGLVLFAYCLYMVFNKEKRTDVYYSKKRNLQADLPVYSSKDVRVVICVLLIVVFGPNKLSILFNFFHRKSVTQLKFTMIFAIVFILNCSEDEFNFSGVTFVARERQDRMSKLFEDLFFGFSTQRTDRLTLKICYAVFDLVIYPNICFFIIMVVLFFIVVILIVVITFLNYTGLTNIDIEDRGQGAQRRIVGLTKQEVSKLVESLFNEVPHNHKHGPTKQQPNENAQDLLQTSQSSGKSDSGISCSICYIPFTADSKVIALPKCEHLYHTECIHSWFKTRSTCPICRLDMRDLLRTENNTFFLFDKLDHSMLRMAFD